MKNRHYRVRIATLALAALTVLSASASQAQQFRFFVRQSSGLFEVLTGSPGGGRFIISWRGYIDGMPIVGYTDRASRGESIYTRISGSGWAIAGVRSNAFNFYAAVPLPFGLWQTVSRNPAADNIYAQVWQGNYYNERRLPIGTR